MRFYEFKTDNEIPVQGLRDTDPLQEKVEHFVKWVYEQLHLKKPIPTIMFSTDTNLAQGKHRTGYYSQDTHVLYVYAKNRNLVDILRTVAHEMVHEKQDEEGRLKPKKSPPGSPNEREADWRAGYLMKLYLRQHPDIIDGEVDEDWRHWVAGLGAASALAGGGGAAYDAYKASQSAQEPTAVVAKSNFKKGAEKLAKDAIPKTSVTGSPHEKFLTKAAVDAGIKGEELAQFLGQTAHESHNFKTMIEYGDNEYFKKYEPVFKKDKKTKKFILDPKTKKPKNFNPTAEILGNTMPGDGVKYKGRGYIQLTGKWNYEQAGKALGLDLLKNPQLVEKPEVAAKVAVWFWKNRVAPKVGDFGDTKASTKPINPGLKHLDQRKEKFHSFKTAMK